MKRKFIKRISLLAIIGVLAFSTGPVSIHAGANDNNEDGTEIVESTEEDSAPNNSRDNIANESNSGNQWQTDAWLNNWEYENNYNIILKKYKGNGGAISIPGKAKIYGESKKVQLCSYTSLFPNNNVTSLKLEDGIVIPSSVSKPFAGMSNCQSIKFGAVSFENNCQLRSLFTDCSAKSVDMTKLTTTNVTSMNQMFYNSSISTITLNNMTNPDCVDMSSMFEQAKVSNLNISNFAMTKVSNCSRMFYGASGLSSINLSKIKTSTALTNIQGMFGNCTSLSELNLSGLNTSKVNNVEKFLSGASKIEALDLSALDFSSVSSNQILMESMKSLKVLYTPRKTGTGNITPCQSKTMYVYKIETIDGKIKHTQTKTTRIPAKLTSSAVMAIAGTNSRGQRPAAGEEVHIHRDGITRVPATCASPVIYYTICMLCNERIVTYSGPTIDSSKHSYSKIQVIAPTATEKGYTKYTCEYCGDSFITDEVAALGTGSPYTNVSVTTANTSTSKNNKTELVSKSIKKTKIKSKKGKRKAITIKWKKAAKVDGYQIQISTSKNFSKNTKSINIGKQKTTSKTIKRLKGKKRYYVRIRSYRKAMVEDVNTKIFSYWSTAVKIKTK